MAHEPTTPMRLDSRLEQQAAHAHSALSLRTLLRQLHLWLGMPLGLLLVVVSLSGSALPTVWSMRTIPGPAALNAAPGWSRTWLRS